MRNLFTSKILNLVFLSLLISSCTYIKSSRDDVRCINKGPIEIHRYVLQGKPIKIPQVVQNASGLAFNPVTKTLLLVLNRPTQVIELGLDGNVKRIIPLLGFDDTEGITLVYRDLFAIVEEKRKTICLIQINHKTASIDYAGVAKIHMDQDNSGKRRAGNNGLEGITYDAKRKLFFVANEKKPVTIYQLPWTDVGESDYRITNPDNVDMGSLILKDLSGLYFHSCSGNLLLLSEKSRCVVEYTMDGKAIGRLSLNTGSARSLRKNTRPEGITMDDNNRLYICSEPNILYVFTKKE